MRNWIASLVFLIATPALAWNAAGHRLIANIAWEQLSPSAREESGHLLRAHPDYERWLKRAGEDEAQDPVRAAFIEASTWADDIRSDPRFYNAGIDVPTPVLAGFPDMERRRDWHYVNRPLDPLRRGQAPPPTSGKLDRQLVALAAQLADPQTQFDAKVYALPWLIHLVGDSHQPLHTTAKLTSDGTWDRLGSSVLLDNPFDARKAPITLHAFWDSLPGPPWLRGSRLDSTSRALTALHPHAPPVAASGQWINESWLLARTQGYPPEVEANYSPGKISDDFLEQSREIARRRIAEAGYRLAGLLNGIFSGRQAGSQ